MISIKNITCIVIGYILAKILIESAILIFKIMINWFKGGKRDG